MRRRPLATHLSRLIWLSLLPLLLLAVWIAVDWVRSDQMEMQAATAQRLTNHTASIDDFLEARILALTLLANSPLADDPTPTAAACAKASGASATCWAGLIWSR